MKARILVLLLATPGMAHGQAATQAPFEVMRPGDRAMTCDALITEVNQLNVRLAQLQDAKRAHQAASAAVDQRNARRSTSIGLLGTMRGMLPFHNNAAGVAGQMGSTAAVNTAQVSAQRAADRDSLNASAAVAADAQTPSEEQRRQRLMQIASDKHC